MLHCTMDTSDLKVSLQDVLADLWHARREGDLGRLALLSYCDMRRWARIAHREGLAQRSRDLVLSCPHATRAHFLAEVDALISEAERALEQFEHPAQTVPVPGG